MKAEFDKEIDSLLRESARRGRAVSVEPGVRAGGGVPHAAHLDADEQSAYAENALPAAARAHYAAHLADCDDCRRSVTGLALAAGIPAQLEPRETATAQAVATNITWRERLGALFAPRAWRYAVPALALLLISAVAFIMLTRKPREDASIAQHNTTETQRAKATQPEAHHAPQNGNVADATPAVVPGVEGVMSAPEANASAPNQNVPASKEEIAANSSRTDVAQPSLGAAASDAAAPPPPAPASGGGAGARSVSELPTPAPVMSDAVTITSDREAKARSGEAAELARIEQKRGNVENRQYENRQREQISGPRRNSNNEQARNTRADDAPVHADKQDGNYAIMAPTPTPPPPPAATSAMKSARRREADRSKDESRPAEDSERVSTEGAKLSTATRSIAGRKFRRDGDAWIDTAYKAGQSYTVVRRNSEQFRALVADEPELRRIAGALGGDITVVWKGRAYRIK
ncbi:MAG TPA: hypothetical protein VF527_21935 [Pyrinomonadaceae bacterium]|jgi:hypothetical protein